MFLVGKQGGAFMTISNEGPREDSARAQPDQNFISQTFSYLFGGVGHQVGNPPSEQPPPAAALPLPEPEDPDHSTTVPGQIIGFLSKADAGMYCDRCIQRVLGLKWRQQVQLVTATLAATRLFQRNAGRCRQCGELKQVTRQIRGE